MTDVKKLRELAEILSEAKWKDDGDWHHDCHVGARILDHANGEWDDMAAVYLSLVSPITILALLDRLERYEAALKFYAAAGNWESGLSSWFDRSKPMKPGIHTRDIRILSDEDRGKRAREALKEDE